MPGSGPTQRYLIPCSTHLSRGNLQNAALVRANIEAVIIWRSDYTRIYSCTVCLHSCATRTEILWLSRLRRACRFWIARLPKPRSACREGASSIAQLFNHDDILSLPYLSKIAIQQLRSLSAKDVANIPGLWRVVNLEMWQRVFFGSAS